MYEITLEDGITSIASLDCRVANDRTTGKAGRAGRCPKGSSIDMIELNREKKQSGDKKNGKTGTISNNN